MSAVITLLTDFGYQDSYVGVMKGVIAGICPTTTVVDLTHAIPPQNLAAARFALLSAYLYFPLGTIHTVVVDPGVGTTRRAIALQIPNGYLVGPDNGVLSGVWAQVGLTAVVELTNPQYWRTTDPSSTFHGRDVFAPVAAHLAAGVPLAALGTAIAPESLIKLTIPAPKITETNAIGHVQHIDHFGNIITTLPAQDIHRQPWKLTLDTTEIPLGHTYGTVKPGEALALVGSHGWLE
ncbi:MAG: SAM-dependent chlorinase/fluorinase, partial [Leptolyngbya sp. SIO1D8]|nr:SAM-dependent chlorinase/fluorinase [Leptolyngbya sp. SIO1D8]